MFSSRRAVYHWAPEGTRRVGARRQEMSLCHTDVEHSGMIPQHPTVGETLLSPLLTHSIRG